MRSPGPGNIAWKAALGIWSLGVGVFPRVRRAGPFLAASALLAAGRLAAQPLEVVPLNPPQLWQPAEFRVDGAPAVANPFDPDLIRVDATITAPSGRSLAVPAFWYQEFDHTLAGGREVLTPAGAPHWRIRFTPTEAGEHRLALRVALGTAAPGGPVAIRFTVPAAAPPGRTGWVRVGPDRRYFETTDGRPLRLIGENVCWSDERGTGTFDYERWFGRMAGAGENFARLWLAPWFLPLEHRPGTLNRYDLAAAWQLDRIFALAAEQGIYLLLCFDHHGMYQVSNRGWGGSNNFWTRNPYSRDAGGPCARPNDFFTDPRARALYQQRLRYLVARYGASPQLLAWQFCNEIDNVYGPLNGDDVLAWHRAMGAWLRAHDPWGHLITTSLTGGSVRPEFWDLPEMDFSMYHSYGDPSPLARLADVAAAFTRRHGKPAMIGEFGTSGANWNSPGDPHLRGFRQGLWGGALGGSAGTAMSWWWDDIDRENVYPLYAALRRILDAAGWETGAWTPVAAVDAGPPPADLAAPDPEAPLFAAPLPLTQSRRFTLTGTFAVADRQVAERSADALPAWLYGSAGPAALRVPIRLIAFFGAEARAVLRVRSAAGPAELVVRIDDAEALREPLGAAGGGDINREFTVAFPAGKHRVEIANAGAESLILDSLRLDGVRPAAFPGGWRYAPAAVGLRQGARAVVYVCSPWTLWPAGATRFNPAVQTGRSLRLADWPPGRYTAAWFNPSTGERVAETHGAAGGNELTLPLPDFNDDLAGIVDPAPAGGPQR